MKVSKEEINSFIEENDMVLLYFGNHTCSICVDMEPKIKSILEKYPLIKYKYINIEENIKVTRDFSIFTIPGVLVYADGREVVREARYLSMEDLDNKIGRYYRLLMD